MEEMKDRIRIPRVTYQGDDRKLKERIFKFKAGSFRIAVFTLVGLFMGFYSDTYVRDTFFPTKLITAVPYKIMEAIYQSVLPVQNPIPPDMRGWAWNMIFPYSYAANLMAEPLTTMLIGGALYGSLGYFTGDKRVFTLQRFLKFAVCWCVVILLVIGAAFGFNAGAEAANEKFGKVEAFFFYREDGSGFSGKYGIPELTEEDFYQGFAPGDVVRDRNGELPLGIYFDGGMRYGLYRIHYEKQYVVTEQGKVYHISEEFVRYVKDELESNSRNR